MCSAGNSLATNNFGTHYSSFEIFSKSSQSIVLKLLLGWGVCVGGGVNAVFLYLESVTTVQFFKNVNIKRMKDISSRTIEEHC